MNVIHSIDFVLTVVAIENLLVWLFIRKHFNLIFIHSIVIVSMATFFAS